MTRTGGLRNLETFLGGMETGGVRLSLLHHADLETFLGGMETVGLNVLLDRNGHHLETFLGGMETYPARRDEAGRYGP